MRRAGSFFHFMYLYFAEGRKTCPSFYIPNLSYVIAVHYDLVLQVGLVFLILESHVIGKHLCISGCINISGFFGFLDQNCNDYMCIIISVISLKHCNKSNQAGKAGDPNAVETFINVNKDTNEPQEHGR